MANQTTLTFAGDADKLEKASKDAEKAISGVGDQAKSSAQDFDNAGKSGADLTDRIGKLGAGVDGASTAIDDASGILQGWIDLQNQSYERSQKQARAANDVAQAQEDLNQAYRDGKQAAIDADQAAVDLQQAQLDQKNATKALADAIKEHGRNSAEARQAGIDLAQTGVDIKQAQEDAAQATRDASQANIDAKSAQLDLNDAQREAAPPDVQKWSDQLGAFAPVLQGITGIVGLYTAAQWALNSATLAWPVVWIIAAIAAVIAIIILIVKHWDTVKKAGSVAWNAIKAAAANTWEFLKKIPGWLGDAFKGIAKAITWPFRTAFNFIADAWNHTIGGLQFSIPSWVPGIGGNSFGVPNIPHFHTGGVVPGGPGSEMLAVLQGGEKISHDTGGGSSDNFIPIGSDGSQLGDLLVQLIAAAVARKGGRPGQLGLRTA